MTQKHPAQKQQTQKQPQDPYGQRGKSLTSGVQRLRGWVGSDPARSPELADALVQLTEHRLLGHGYPSAATDAQESVRLAAQLLSATGPIGPYTAVKDATRCVTALVHLAAVQVGLARPDAAGQTMESAQNLQQQLREVELEEELTARTATWALWCSARAALASGDVTIANEHADAALSQLEGSGLRDDPDAGYLAIDVDRLVSDCRWTAGHVDESLPHLHLAKDRYDALVDGRLQAPGRLSPALVERLAEPLFGLYRDLADRLVATGEVDLGLVTRRTLVELLQGLAGRLGEPTRLQLASALADLADDLLAVDRLDEAESAAAQAAALGLDRAGSEPVRLLVAAVHARALTRADRASEAVAALHPVLHRADEPSAARAVGLAALAEAHRAAGELEAAESTEQAFNDLARDLLGPGEAPQTARAAVQDLARGVVPRGGARSEPAHEAPARDVEAELQRETAAWLEAERAEAHRLEVERLEQARIDAERREVERLAAERAAAEQLAAERAEAERAERLEAERRAAAEEEERLATKRRREERLEAHRLEVERLEAERLEAERLETEHREAERQAGERTQLAGALETWEDAKARRDRRGARAANERVVELLRSAAQTDPGQYGPRLRQALEELSSARLRSGDILGSRALAREAKVLAQTLGR